MLMRYGKHERSFSEDFSFKESLWNFASGFSELADRVNPELDLCRWLWTILDFEYVLHGSFR